MCEIFYSTYYLSTYFVHGTVIGALEYTMMQTVRETIMKTNNKRKEPGKECRQSRVPLRGSPKCTYWGSMQILLGALHMSIPTLKSLRGKLSEHSHLVHLSRYLLHKVLCQGGQWELKLCRMVLARHSVHVLQGLFHVTQRHCSDKGRPVGKAPTVPAHSYFSSLPSTGIYGMCYIIKQQITHCCVLFLFYFIFLNITSLARLSLRSSISLRWPVQLPELP